MAKSSILQYPDACSHCREVINLQVTKLHFAHEAAGYGDGSHDITISLLLTILACTDAQYAHSYLNIIKARYNIVADIIFTLFASIKRLRVYATIRVCRKRHSSEGMSVEVSGKQKRVIDHSVRYQTETNCKREQGQGFRTLSNKNLVTLSHHYDYSMFMKVQTIHTRLKQNLLLSLLAFFHIRNSSIISLPRSSHKRSHDRVFAYIGQGLLVSICSPWWCVEFRPIDLKLGD